MPPRRFFLLRCAEERIVNMGVKKCAWPVSHGVVDRLNEAFAAGGEVVLIFTVTMSGHFQGCARMTGPANMETATSAETTFGYPACRLEWIHQASLPYAEAEHLINPLSDPPQPIRAGKDGTEIEPKVAEELLSLLGKEAAKPKPPPPAAGAPAAAAARPPPPAAGAGAVAPPAAMGGGAGAMVGGMPGMVGAGLMGMPHASMMGMNPLAMGMMNPLMAGMMNPMAMQAMMMGGMQGMMAAGMRPGGMPLPGAAAAAGASGAGVPAGPAATGERDRPGIKPEGPPPGFDGPGGRDGRYGGRDERYEWERERDRDWGRYDGLRGGPPFREGPPFRDVHPPHGFRDGPYRDGGFDRFGDRGPPRRPGYGAPPPHMRGPPGRGFGGPPPGAEAPDRQREAEPDPQNDLLHMSYDAYVDRFRQLKEVQGGGAGAAQDGGGKAANQAGTEGKENGAAEGAPAADAGAAAEGAGVGTTAEVAAPAGGTLNVAAMQEDEYVEHCQRFCTQMGMPFDAGMVRQNFRAMKAMVAQQA